MSSINREFMHDDENHSHNDSVCSPYRFGKFELSVHTCNASRIYKNHGAVRFELPCLHLKQFLNKEEETKDNSSL